MTRQTIDAVFEHGVFRVTPPLPVTIPDGQSVRLVVEIHDSTEDVLTLATHVFDGLSEGEIASVERIAATEAERVDAPLKIQVLLAEYAALQSGIVSRTNTRFGLLGLGLGLITFVFVPREAGWHFQHLVGVLASVILMLVWWRLGWLINRCAIRLIEIEKRINSLVGEELLIWQNLVARTLLFHKFFPLPDIADQKHQPLNKRAFLGVRRIIAAFRRFRSRRAMRRFTSKSPGGLFRPPKKR